MGFMVPSQIEELLEALGEWLDAGTGGAIDLVICGGTALNVQGFVDRPTRDVDVVAILSPDDRQTLISSQPLPGDVLAARDRVSRDFALDGKPPWLNDGPGDLVRFGLPSGCQSRFLTRTYGRRLTLHFLGREDLICLKLYAYANSMGESRHFHDLKALNPGEEELRFALNWCLAQQDGLEPDLREALLRLGVDDLARSLE